MYIKQSYMFITIITNTMLLPCKMTSTCLGKSVGLSVNSCSFYILKGCVSFV